MKYQMVVAPLDEADGGGFSVFFPDLPGCISDGESPAEAVANGLDALDVWLAAQAERGINAPAPGSAATEGMAYIEALNREMESVRAELAAARARIHELEQRRAGAGLLLSGQTFLPRTRGERLRTA